MTLAKTAAVAVAADVAVAGDVDSVAVAFAVDITGNVAGCSF